MRFLVDAQLPPALARWLEGRGHTAEHVADRGMAAARAVWDYAIGVGAIILTLATAACAPASADGGYLEGRAAIGPISPVERVGEPTPTPAPEMCTSWGLVVSAPDGNTEVTSFNLRPDCTFRVALSPGRYAVTLKPTGGIGFSKDLPRTVEVERGKTVRLDIRIDTGIR